MLTRRPHTATPARRQHGVVLFLAMIVVVVMMLAGIALFRSVDMTNLIAGNLAFHQSAIHSADTGIEVAVKWLQDNNNGTILNSDDSTNGYSAAGINASHVPASGQSWDSYWTQTLQNRPPRTLSSNSSGNTVSYVIDRLCALAGPPTGGAKCAASPIAGLAVGNAEAAGKFQLAGQSMIYYRITARVVGPRQTVSYVQATVAL